MVRTVEIAGNERARKKAVKVLKALRKERNTVRHCEELFQVETEIKKYEAKLKKIKTTGVKNND
jgi:hypothetical protein